MASERTRIALNDLAKKIRLESKIKREMKLLYRRMGREMKDQFIASGTVLRAEKFQPEIEAILKDQYTRTFKAFRGDVTETLKSIKDGLEFKQEEDEDVSPIPFLVLGSILDRREERFIETTSQNISQEITRTNQRQMNAAIAGAISALTEDGQIQDVTREEVASEASSAFIRKSNPRANSTAISETQNAAEQQKLDEMQSLVIVGETDGFSSRKVWTAILDDLVRHPHEIADGQMRTIGEPFEVNGELLNRPRDTSLGASAGNVINCRCSSSLSFII